MTDSMQALYTLQFELNCHNKFCQELQLDLFNASQYVDIVLIWVPARVYIAGKERADKTSQTALSN